MAAEGSESQWELGFHPAWLGILHQIASDQESRIRAVTVRWN